MSPAPVTTKTAHDCTDNDDWAVRGDYWLKKLNPVPQYKARKRRKIQKPLILSGHGIRLKVEADTLLITCGFTHYPQAREEYRLFPGDRQLPSRIVILDGDGSITLDALEWLSGQGVPLVQIDWRGEVSGVGGDIYAANPDIVKRQLAMQTNGKGFQFVKRLVIEKLDHACETIKAVSDNSAGVQPLLKSMQNQATRIRKSSTDSIAELRNAESIAAAAYFRYWYTLELRWKGVGRKPIPPEWKQIGTRIGKNGDSNQYATHPVNAILNYAYGVLEHQVKGLAVASGADPSIGYLHSTDRSNAALVYDLMEPVRPIMDREILKLVLARVFSPQDFVLNKNGVVRLHPQFARYVVKTVQDIPEINKVTENNLKNLIGRSK